jgi:hypothetical protein
MYKGQTFTNSK